MAHGNQILVQTLCHTPQWTSIQRKISFQAVLKQWSYYVNETKFPQALYWYHQFHFYTKVSDNYSQLFLFFSMNFWIRLVHWQPKCLSTFANLTELDIIFLACTPENVSSQESKSHLTAPPAVRLPRILVSYIKLSGLFFTTSTENFGDGPIQCMSCQRDQSHTHCSGSHLSH